MFRWQEVRLSGVTNQARPGYDVKLPRKVVILMARMCGMYADAMDCDKQESCDSPLCEQREAWLSKITVEVKHVCGHTTEMRFDLDDAGAELAQAEGQECPSCENERIEAQVDAWEQQEADREAEYWTARLDV
jgi:hypothetical protein